MGILTNKWTRVAALAVATGPLAGCQMSTYEAAALGGGLGRIAADELNIDKTAGTLIGGALGSAIVANQGYCEGTTYVNRVARKDNRTGKVTYDVTTQESSQKCTKRGGSSATPIFLGF